MRFFFCASFAIFQLLYGVNAFSSASGDKQILGYSYGTPGINSTFDYVIVGGGTAGLTVALRLVESGRFSVAVIEAGGFYEVDAGNFTEIPANENIFTEAPASIDWGIATVNQSSLGGREVAYTQGKCLSGSSGRNGMAYHRGTTGSYQKWADLVGDQSFTLPNLMKYFKKSVTFTAPDYAKRGGPPAIYDASAFNILGGPLHVSWWNWFIPVSNGIADGLRKSGFMEIDTIQSGSLFGFSQYPATLHPDKQIRDSSETSFLRSALGKKGYSVYTRTLAKRILFTGKTAIGVEVEASSKVFFLHARKEIILSAGVFRSPQLLMVSGIGPKSTLQELNIPVLVDMPAVGQGSWDHGGFGIGVSVNATSQHLLYSNTSFANIALEQWHSDRSGPLTAFGSNYLAWELLPTKYLDNLSSSAQADLASFPADWPDMQYILSGLGLADTTPGNFAGIGMLPMKPTARGNVTIVSNDTNDNPIVNPNWFGTDTDKQVAIQGFHRAREMISAWGAIDAIEVLPGATVQTDDEIWAFIQASTGPSHHGVATCKMGLPNDSNAVVDAGGRVLGGLSNIRIIDASIFPFLPPGQPTATVYCIAEKLAAQILLGN